MLLIERPQTDPYFNIAAEEYLLRTLEEDCFMLWVNEPSVIIGKHQNAFAEIDRAFISGRSIPVIRRISGGGTVFHDPGNLNFTFISSGEKEKLVDFRRFTGPVIAYLQSLGLPARFEGKNDIRIHGLKVSGNAEHVYRNKVLHHGTLLYSSGLGDLNAAIRGRESLFDSHAVRSVRSRVANIRDLLPQPLSLADFQAGIADFVRKANPGMGTTSLGGDEILGITTLADEKYRTWEWNFGYSPAFRYRNEVQLGARKVDLDLEVKEGIIREVRVAGGPLPGWLKLLRGRRFEAADLRALRDEAGGAVPLDRDLFDRFIRDLLH